MSAAVGTVLFIAFLASLGWALGCAIAVWNTRPVVMFDHKVGHWRAHSLFGTPWRTKRHGVVERKPLERRRHVKALEQTLEHPTLDPLLDRTA